MPDRASSPAIPARAASASIFIATIVGILVLIGFFLSFDLFLARIDRRESDAHAADEYNEGVRLLGEGKASAAAERLGAAATLDRENVAYSLALGEAMLGAGRISDAETTLRGLLDRAGNDGAVNLAMAHVMIRERREQDAKSYFHRAIFGRWGADSVRRRAQARFELIDLLSQQDDKSELLAELLPLEEVSPDSVALRHRLARLFLRAGSPARAANILRGLLHDDPNDAEAYAGMGEAALALGNFRTARADFAEAERLRPGDARFTSRRALADTVLALDPTARGVRGMERVARSAELLSRTMAAVAACPAVLPSLADSARTLLTRSASAPADETLGDDMLGVAADLWAQRSAACAATSDEALRLVQLRLAQ